MKSKFVTSACALAAMSLVSLSAVDAQADGFESFGGLSDTDFVSTSGVSANGLTIFGSSFASDGLSSEAFIWTSTGGIVGLGHLGGDTYSQAFSASVDGSIVVGASGMDNYDAFFGHVGQAFRWTTGGGMTGMGTLSGGTFSAATGISGNGLVIVGQSGSTANNEGEAFRWTSGGGMVGLGVLSGTLVSTATAVNSDGSVIVGIGQVAHVIGGVGTMYSQTAIRWTQVGGMVDIGTSSGFDYSTARAVNADGSIVVGSAGHGADPEQAFRWTQAEGMVDLGSFGGGLGMSVANAVSADGSIVVGGSSTDADPITGEAFIWTEADGMRKVLDMLGRAGVNTGQITLSHATGISADGTVIVGDRPIGSNREAWIAICNSVLCTGLVDPVNIANSFSSVGAVGQTGNAFVGGQLATLSETATQYKESSAPLSFTGSGFYDSDPVGAANIGATYALGGDILIGGSLGGSVVDTPMLYDGESRIFGTSLAAFVASNPDEGLQWLVGANASYFTGSIDREYINGVAIARSSGDVKGNGYGAIVRAGYSLKVAEDVRVTPFGSYTASEAHIDGYTETTGPVPAQFDDIDDEAQTARLGGDVRYNFTADTWTWGTLAWAHRLDDGKSANITGVLAGALPLTTPGVEAADDWVEATAGVRLPLSEGASLTTSVTAVMPSGGYDTTFQARVGLAYAF